MEDDQYVAEQTESNEMLKELKSQKKQNSRREMDKLKRDIVSSSIDFSGTIKIYHLKIKLGISKQIRSFSYSKVLINVTLTFLLPVLLFSIPVIENDNSTFLNNYQNKIQAGVLFSTSISILATIISSYVDQAKANNKNIEDTSNKRNNSKKNSDTLLVIILLAFLLTFFGAFTYGKIDGSNNLNKVGTILQYFLYGFVQILYGIADSEMKHYDSLDTETVEKKNEEYSEVVREKSELLDQNISITSDGKFLG